jgi:hypothetical protein
MSRREVLHAAGVGVVLAAVPPGALAAPQRPAPAGDDLGFLSFGAVVETTLAAFYTRAAAIPGAWTARERTLLRTGHDRHRRNVDRLNAVLGPGDAVPPGTFSSTVTVGSRAGALRVGHRLEALSAGVYLNGVGYAADAGTRILLGRLLAVADGQNALLRHLAGLGPAGLRSPVDLEAAGRELDRYLEDQSS